MAVLLLVQHGQKEQGPGDPGLASLGRGQARRTALALAELGHPARIYSSPLKRAAETGAILAAHFGLSVSYDGRLRERMNWEGEPVQSLESFLADWRRSTFDRDFVPTSGDSSRRAAARMLAAIRDIAAAHPAAMAVAVTHGGVTVDLLRTLIGDEALASSAPALLADGVPSCAITTLRREGGAWTVDQVAFDAHLRP